MVNAALLVPRPAEGGERVVTLVHPVAIEGEMLAVTKSRNDV